MASNHFPRGLVIALACYAVHANAAPQISTIELPKVNGEPTVINGSGFGAFGGEVVSWDDFEGDQLGQKISGLKPIVGPAWSTIYSYNGNGIVIDNTYSISGNKSVKVDWTIDPESVRAFGWSNKGPFSKLYISYWRRMEGNFQASTSNHKQFYLYGNVNQFPQGMPFIPGGQTRWGFYNNVSSGAISDTNPNPNNISTPGWNWDGTANTFQRWEFNIQLNSPYTEKNGVIQVWLDGKLGIDNHSYAFRNVDGEFIDFRLGHMAQGFYNTAKAWFDDLYIATTQARLEICDKPVYSECSIKELQYVDPANWSDSRISFSIRNAQALKSNEVYLYVVDANGVTSEPLKVPKPTAPK